MEETFKRIPPEDVFITVFKRKPTEEELWMGKTTHRYYADPTKTTGKSTKNFSDMTEAVQFQASKGGKGIIISEIGKPKRCEYCNAFPVCTQKDKWFPAA